LEGRALRQGDALAALPANEGELQEGAIVTPLLERPSEGVRVVLGPQDDYFTPEAIATFFAEPYALSARFDRMGCWLEGPPLAHAGGFDIVSDGIALGAIQVPGSGQPVVLLRDHQSTGGYPKLGALARADVGAFAQHRPGERVRFAACGVDAARAALLAVWAALDAPLELRSLRGEVPAELLHANNLIGGVVDGSSW
ncbi:MAG TPA: biotin-dependent carboxyltransferase family protein, partial [Verrucomicrobiae bacterium]|nr:biotin-dependent carboxyltransferase family protein [Verrucomicrobiae bacterium]